MKPRLYSQFRGFRAIFCASLLSLLRAPSQLLFNLVFPVVLLFLSHYFPHSPWSPPRVAVQINNSAADSLFVHLSTNGLFHADTVGLAHTPAGCFASGYEAVICTQVFSDHVGVIVHYKNPPNRDLVHVIRGVADELFSNKGIFVKFEQKTHAIVASVPIAVDFFAKICAFVVFTSSVFGAAFTFFNLKKNNVFKLIFVTPVRKLTILAAELSSRFCFLALNVLMVVSVAVWGLNVDMPGGWRTVEFVGVLFVGIVAFIPYGFIISMLARSLSAVPVIANISVVPQWVLGGLLVDNSALPSWIQVVANALPFTNFVQVLRGLCTQHIEWPSLAPQMGVVMLWGVIGIVGGLKMFHWE